MLCKWCQIKVARNCVKSVGGCVPLNVLSCDFEGHCDVEDYSKRIIEIFQPERLSPEGTIFEEVAEYGSKGKFGLLNSTCDSPNSENK